MDKSKIEMCQTCTRVLPVKKSLLDVILRRSVEKERCGGPVKMPMIFNIAHAPGVVQTDGFNRVICSKDLTVELLSESLRFEIECTRAKAKTIQKAREEWDSLSEAEKQRSLDSPVSVVF